MVTVRDVERAVTLARRMSAPASVRTRLERIHMRAYQTEFLHAYDELFVDMFLEGEDCEHNVTGHGREKRQAVH